MNKAKKIKKILKKLFEQRKFLKKKPFFLKAFSIFCGLVIVTGIFFSLIFQNKIYPGITINGMEVAGLNQLQARNRIKAKVDEFSPEYLVLKYKDKEWSVSLEDLKLNYDVDLAAYQAYSIGRKNFWSKFLILPQSLINGIDLPIPHRVDEKILEASVSAIARDIDVPMIPPSITVLEYPDPGDGSHIKINAGEKGQSLDKKKAIADFKQRFNDLENREIYLVVKEEGSNFSTFDPKLTKMRAERMLDKKLSIFYVNNKEKSGQEWQLLGEELLYFISFDGGFDANKIASYSGMLAGSINREAQNAAFIFENGRVSEFKPAKDGLVLDTKEASKIIGKTLSDLELSLESKARVELVPQSIAPGITIEDVNSLGIKELLGKGESTFHGSIANREHNISLASSRITGYLVSPETVFSFNKTVGDISAATGYRQSYIIKDGQTILDDGGGVCQVSTTLFRAALDAGLPITQRLPHSYRVGYYEQNSKAGYDATVFAPSVDLKFENNTPAHLLIQAQVDTKANSLVFEIYGTDDGRTATISNHRMWDVAPPPPDLYQDDPGLPAGTIKQIEWKAWGAKVKFDYLVVRNGEKIFEKTFYSNYQPWQSVFLRGTGT